MIPSKMATPALLRRGRFLGMGGGFEVGSGGGGSCEGPAAAPSSMKEKMVDESKSLSQTPQLENMITQNLTEASVRVTFLCLFPWINA